MLKKTIKYEDFNGNKLTEDFYFNLTKAEVAELELSEKGGLSEAIKKAVKEDDNATIMRIFKGLILKAIGVKSEDGKRFIKTDKIREEFLQTEAYSVLFMELATSENAASSFMNSIIPGDVKPKNGKASNGAK